MKIKTAANMTLLETPFLPESDTTSNVEDGLNKTNIISRAASCDGKNTVDFQSDKLCGTLSFSIVIISIIPPRPKAIEKLF